VVLEILVTVVVVVVVEAVVVVEDVVVVVVVVVEAVVVVVVVVMVMLVVVVVVVVGIVVVVVVGVVVVVVVVVVGVFVVVGNDVVGAVVAGVLALNTGVENASSAVSKSLSTISCPADPTFCSLVSPEEDLLKVYSPGGCRKRKLLFSRLEEGLDATDLFSNQAVATFAGDSVSPEGTEALSGESVVLLCAVVCCPPLSLPNASCGELVASRVSPAAPLSPSFDPPTEISSGCTICRYGSSLLILGTTFPPLSHGGGSLTLSVTVPPTVSTAN